MIKTLEKTGRTEDDAIAAALKELGLDRDDVSVEILERAKSGFFGIGAVPAKVRISYECADAPAAAPVPEVKKPAPAPVAKAAKQPEAPKQDAPKAVKAEEQKSKEAEAPKVPAAAPKKEGSSAVGDEEAAIREFLTGLFERMGISAEISITRRENGGFDVDLSGEGIGAVIGRRGETLDSIQHLTNYVVNRGNDKRMHINIDAESYRSKREESLTRLAEKMAEKAIKYKRNMALEPMNSYERHVIHTALQNYKGVTTASTGEEPNRRVVVTYVKQESDEAPKKPKPREWA